MATLTPPALLSKLATGRNILLLLLLFFIFTMAIMPTFEADIKALSGGVGVIDLQFFYTPSKVFSMLEAYGPEGRRLYLIAQWTVDLIFPVIDGALLAAALLWAGEKRRWWLGFAVAAFDWLENIAVTWMLARFPVFDSAAAWISCFFTMAKWTMLGVCALLLIWRGAVKLLRYFRADTSRTASEP